MNYLTQQSQILALLKQGKVNSYELTYKFHIKQAPTRIKELREQGYQILSQTKPDRSVDYCLDDSPSEINVSLKTQPKSDKNPNKGRTVYIRNNGVLEQITI